jgi:hypothetical protein
MACGAISESQAWSPTPLGPVVDPALQAPRFGGLRRPPREPKTKSREIFGGFRASTRRKTQQKPKESFRRAK